jgi:hypothetical protein
LRRGAAKEALSPAGPFARSSRRPATPPPTSGQLRGRGFCGRSLARVAGSVHRRGAPPPGPLARSSWRGGDPIGQDLLPSLPYGDGTRGCRQVVYGRGGRGVRAPARTRRGPGGPDPLREGCAPAGPRTRSERTTAVSLSVCGGGSAPLATVVSLPTARAARPPLAGDTPAPAVAVVVRRNLSPVTRSSPPAPPPNPSTPRSTEHSPGIQGVA